MAGATASGGVAPQAKKLVILEYSDLVAGVDLSATILEAFGNNGLGALAVRGIPDYAELRATILAQGHKIAKLSDEAKAGLESPATMYNTGWSFGRERFNNQPDLSKGSFYANPLLDNAAQGIEAETWPSFYPDNIWPTEHIPEFEGAFKSMGKSMFDVSILLAKQIDNVIRAKFQSYPENKLSDAIKGTRKVKGRLLYYYPTDSSREDGWIGWHNDSGFLTALPCAQFINDNDGSNITNPDPEGGLYIVDRESDTTRVRIPIDTLAFQCGECLQIISGGLLKATPHCVRPSKQPEGMKVGRASFPVFIDTDAGFELSCPAEVEESAVFDQEPESRVPKLQDRWTGNGQLFADFLTSTFKTYYEVQNK